MPVLTRLDYAREVKLGLNNPRRLCHALGLDKDSNPQANGLFIRCPFHRERTPSCSVFSENGETRFKCWGCETAGDALHLIAVARGLDQARDFREILATGAQIAGLYALESEIRGDVPAEEKRHQPLPQPSPEPEPDYPPTKELLALWEEAGSVEDDTDASEYLVTRRICPVETSGRKLARVLLPHQQTPPWARYRGRSWQQTGHRLVLRMFDASGHMRSIRGWRITEGDSPKRLPPAGFKTMQLVAANHAAWEMLSGRDSAPRTLTVVEGEPDFLTHATRTYDAVIGLISGSWTSKFADAVPTGSEVVVRTHHDLSGDRYAAKVIASLSARCAVWRSEP